MSEKEKKGTSIAAPSPPITGTPDKMSLIERQAILAMELSLRACKEIHDNPDRHINWDRAARLAHASADCAVSMLSLRQDRDIRMQRAQQQHAANEARWAEIAKCSHTLEGGAPAFELTKERGAICSLCNISDKQLREREKEIEERARVEDETAKKMRGGNDAPDQ